jgi:hypothetical protein
MKIGTSGMTVPRRVLTNPLDEAIVTAVVVLKFETIISLPAEISSTPTGERISAIDRLVVISDYRCASINIRFIRVANGNYLPTLLFPAAA